LAHSHHGTDAFLYVPSIPSHLSSRAKILMTCDLGYLDLEPTPCSHADVHVLMLALPLAHPPYPNPDQVRMTQYSSPPLLYLSRDPACSAVWFGCHQLV